MTEVSKLDVRILTLKRWNLPQRQSLYQIWQDWSKLEEDKNKDMGKYGDYVSFQNYHFVDLAKVDLSEDKNATVSAYEKICDIRKQYDDTRIPDNYNEDLKRYIRQRNKDIYIQQNMVLFGRPSSFWNQATRTLYISMLQLADDDAINFSALEEQIASLFESKQVLPSNWTLYYSLDFCDMVLLVKDVELSTFHNILWELSPVGKVAHEGKRYIRDTITVYTFPTQYLMERFKQFDQEKRVVASKHTGQERLALSVSLSVQQLSGWDKFRTHLDERLSGISHFYNFRTPGRYDIQVIFPEVSFAQTFWVIYWIDKLCSDTSYSENFGGYEIVPMAETYAGAHNGADLKKSNQFLDVSSQALDCLLGKYSTEYDKAFSSNTGDASTRWWYGYASEISRSLIALLQNGFAEEFALSVFHSFAEYLKFVIGQLQSGSQECQDALGHNEAEAQIYYLQRSYFEALNMLMHCTMHGGQQFIQAPGFNATLFNVPPQALVILFRDCLSDYTSSVRFVLIRTIIFLPTSTRLSAGHIC